MNTLIVDDRQLAVNAMVAIMKEIDPGGSHVGLISSTEALSFLKNHSVDVAFLDIEMSELNGLALAKKMQEMEPKLNIIFVTGHVEYALDAHNLFASGYLMKPPGTEDVKKVLNNLRYPVEGRSSRVFVRCFGNFEVFVDGSPLVFRRTKTKELLAYLIDCRGSFCSTGEVMGILWEDAGNIDSRASQIRSFMSDMRKTFEDAGLGDIIVKEHNAIAIRPDLIECDYYQFMDGDPKGINAFMGEYMKQYTWAEMRLGELTMMEY